MVSKDVWAHDFRSVGLWLAGFPLGPQGRRDCSPQLRSRSGQDKVQPSRTSHLNTSLGQSAPHSTSSDRSNFEPIIWFTQWLGRIPPDLSGHALPSCRIQHVCLTEHPDGFHSCQSEVSHHHGSASVFHGNTVCFHR